jgi:hypothetical protein
VRLNTTPIGGSLPLHFDNLGVSRFEELQLFSLIWTTEALCEELEQKKLQKSWNVSTIRTTLSDFIQRQ